VYIELWLCVIVSYIDAGMKSSMIAALICGLLIPFTCFLLWYHAEQFAYLAPSMCDIMNKVPVSNPAI